MTKGKLCRNVITQKRIGRRIHIRISSVALWKKMTHGVREIYERKMELKLVSNV